jgi:hypothetical protein
MGIFDFIGDLTGANQARAAKEAAGIQAESAEAAAARIAASTPEQVAALQQGQQGQQATLDPFNQFGQSFIPGAQQAFQQQQSLFGPNAVQNFVNDPAFQSLLQQGQEGILGRQAALGRVGTGETQEFLQDSALRTGFDVINQERQAALANFQSSLNPIGLGFNAASQIGGGQFQTGGNIANTLRAGVMGETGFQTDAAAATAGGVVGAANAMAAGTGNLLNLGTAAFTGGLSLPFGGFGGAPTTFGAGGSPGGSNF